MWVVARRKRETAEKEKERERAAKQGGVNVQRSSGVTLDIGFRETQRRDVRRGIRDGSRALCVGVETTRIDLRDWTN